MGYSEGPNLYSYVRANLMVLVDPYGLWDVGYNDGEGNYVHIESHSDPVFNYDCPSYNYSASEYCGNMYFNSFSANEGPEKRYKFMLMQHKMLSEANNNLNWFGKGLDCAGVALNYADDTLTYISDVMLIASAAWFLLDPEPFSKVGGGAVLGTGSLCAKGVKYTVISTVRAGVVALRGSRLAYVGYRAAITTQTTCRVYKWGNDRLQKNMNDDGGGNFEKFTSDNEFTIQESRKNHIFRNSKGHLPDTSTNRQLLNEVANDKTTTLRMDKHGNVWSARLNSDGTWVQTRGGDIINGGINKTPNNFNSLTGLSQLK